jgi:DNA-binding response OmpR family regulator
MIFEALYSANGRVVTHEHLTDLLWGDDPNGGPDWPQNVIRAMIHHAKRKMAGTGMSIVCVWGQGYHLSRPDLSAPAVPVAA